MHNVALVGLLIGWFVIGFFSGALSLLWFLCKASPLADKSPSP